MSEDPSDAAQATLECQQRFWRALERKDAALLAQALAEDFVCRAPGEPDQERAAFIAVIAALPIDILSVAGESIAVRVVGDIAILTGVQAAQLRLPNGAEATERLALTNVFQRTADGWRMILAHPVPLATDPLQQS